MSYQAQNVNGYRHYGRQDGAPHPPQSQQPILPGAGALILEVNAIEASRSRYAGPSPAVVPEYHHWYQNAPPRHSSPVYAPPQASHSGGSSQHAYESGYQPPRDQVYPMIQSGRTNPHQTKLLPGPNGLFGDSLGTPNVSKVEYIRPLSDGRDYRQSCRPCLGDTEVYRSLLQMPTLRQYARRRMPVVRLPIPMTFDESSVTTMPAPDVTKMDRHIPFVPSARASTDDYPGISMYELLMQEARIHGAMDCIRLLSSTDSLRVIFWAQGYNVAIDDIHTICGHGTLTRMGLAYHIAYNFQRRMTRDPVWQGSNSVHQNDGAVPSVKNARRLRLISLFTLPHNPDIWYCELGLIVDRNPDRD